MIAMNRPKTMARTPSQSRRVGIPADIPATAATEAGAAGGVGAAEGIAVLGGRPAMRARRSGDVDAQLIALRPGSTPPRAWLAPRRPCRRPPRAWLRCAY